MRLRDGVYTASAGNMAQGVAWGARALGVPCTVIMPDSAPATKVEAVRRLGAEIVFLPYDEWWATLVNHGREGMRGAFIHPVADRAVMAGNGTIGLEIAEDLPDADRRARAVRRRRSREWHRDRGTRAHAAREGLCVRGVDVDAADRGVRGG